MQTRKLIILLVIYAIIFTVLVTYTTLPEKLRTIERSLEIQRTVDVEKIKLFDVMADVKHYPSILPDNYVSVEILSNTTNSIMSLETIKEAGVQTTFKVQHTIIPFQSHQITILDGDAKGTSIMILFNSLDDNKTQISATLDLKVKGIMYPFGILPEQNIRHAFNTILDHFVSYLQN